MQQGVLLKEINDDFETLKELYERLIYHGILPYYLHRLDRVKGTKHFEVEETQGKSLIAKLRNCLPGYAVPHFVEEIPGKASKIVIS